MFTVISVYITCWTPIILGLDSFNIYLVAMNLFNYVAFPPASFLGIQFNFLSCCAAWWGEISLQFNPFCKFNDASHSSCHSNTWIFAIYHDKICSRIPCLTRGSHCDRRRKCWEEKTRLQQEMSFLSYTIASKSMVPNCTILKGQLNILSTSCTRSAVLQKPSQYSLKMKVQLFKLNQPPG